MRRSREVSSVGERAREAVEGSEESAVESSTVFLRRAGREAAVKERKER